jgi:phage terminase large subunit
MEPQTTPDKSRTIQFKPFPKQFEALLILLDLITNELLYGGGAGGGKTKLACSWLTIVAMKYPATRWMIGRRQLKRLKQSTLVTLLDVFREWGLRPSIDYNYNSSAGTITFWNKSEFLLMDLAKMPTDPNYDRLGSLEFTGGFIEEGQEVEEKAKEVVMSRIRYKLTEYNLVPKLLITCNPSKNYLYRDFYKPHKEGKLPAGKAFIKSLVTDNPHISPHYIESLKKIKDRILRERLLLGNWEYEDSDTALFSYDNIVDIFSNTLPQDEKLPDGTPKIKTEQYIICDAARYGNDKAVIERWEGLRRVERVVFPKSATTDIENAIRNIAAIHRIPMSNVCVDEEGVGGGVVDHLKCKGFVGGSGPIDVRYESEKKSETEYKINYRNLRAQCYHKLAEMTEDHLISVQDDDPEYQQELAEELEQIRVIKIDLDAKFQIISKDDIKAAIGRSPDYSDTLMMRMYFEINPKKTGWKVYGRK